MSKIDEIMKDFNKKYKEDLMHYGISNYDYERIPFTSPRLNYMTFGGLPEGKLIEFYGEEHGGKTTTALDIVANFQIKYPERKVVWADCENTFDVVWAIKLGVDVESLIILQPSNQSAEVIFQVILDLISTGEVGLAVIDSFGVMVSQQALEKELVDKTYAGISKALTDFGGRACGICNKYKCTVIGINQIREDFNSTFGGTKTVGGKGWKHDVSVRLEFRMGTYIDDKNKALTRGTENPAGNMVNVTMKKNKTCPPTRRTGFYTLKYLSGIDYLWDFIEVGLKFGIIEKSGSWFSLINIDTGEIIEDKLHGQDNVRKFLEENTDVLATLEELVEARLYSDEVRLDEIDEEE